MTATFLSFQTASRALAASKANIDLTGNNIANVNTEGYSRQRVDLTSISMSGYTQRYTVPGASIGLGVDVSKVSQTRDPFLDSRFRMQNAEANQYNVTVAGLSDLENVFDEIENNGLQSELLNFANQLQNLSQSPTSTDLGLVVRTAAQKVTQMLNTYATQTEQVRQQQIYDLKNVVIANDFNTTVKNIANLNTQIRDEVTHGNEPNELYDKRNMLIDKLSGMANIRVTTTPEKISESLTIENLNISIYNPSGGDPIGLVSNGLYNTLSVNEKDETLKIEINSSFGNHPKDVTSAMAGGSIKGYLDVINGKGSYADTTTSENTFRGALYYKEAMNTFASNFAATLNNVNNYGRAVADKNLFESSDIPTIPSTPMLITASNIRITDAWADSPSHLVTSTATPGGSDNVLRMISSLSNKVTFYKEPSDPTSDVVFEGTVNQYMSGLVGELALDTELNANFASTATNVLYSLSDSRDSISGVSLDEEGVNLLAYQKSYNAAARYFTVLDEAVNTIINNMGLVGR